MTKIRVKYVGVADVRELSAADFKSLGVEGVSKTSFNRGVAVEVTAPTRDALLTLDGFEGVPENESDAEAK